MSGVQLRVRLGDRVRIVIPLENLAAGSGLLYPNKGMGIVAIDPRARDDKYYDEYGRLAHVNLDKPFLRRCIGEDGRSKRPEEVTHMWVPSWLLEPEAAAPGPVGADQKCEVCGGDHTQRHPVEVRTVEYRTSIEEAGRGVVAERQGQGREAVKELFLCDVCSVTPKVVETRKVVETTFLVPRGWSKSREVQERKGRVQQRFVPRPEEEV